MKSFPETGFGNFESSLNSLVQSSPSLLQQMSQLQSAGAAGSLKFPELSITKHDGPVKPGDNQDVTSSALQITPRSNPSSMTMSSMSSETGSYNSCRSEVRGSVDIQDQINMLRSMPDFMRMNNTTEETEDISGEEMEEEENDVSLQHNMPNKVLMQQSAINRSS